jgi:hypothetical protein
MRGRSTHPNSFPADGRRTRARASSALDERHARLGGYYLRDEHELIHRHTEQVQLNADHTAEWRLTVDFELPTHPLPRCSQTPDGENLFLFPLAYLKKSDARTGFRVEAQNGSLVPIPTKSQCDRVTGLAAAEAANWLLTTAGGERLELDLLAESLQAIPKENPYLASTVVDRIRRQLDEAPDSSGGEIVLRWEDAGLLDVLKMLIEHSLIWVPLWGRPGEHHSITLSQEISLERRPFLRWNFGTIDPAEEPGLRRKIVEWLGDPLSNAVIDTGDGTYGRRSYRLSFPALGQRLGEPLAWMPVEFDFPTIYTKRCTSYHFELTCPPGLSPRDLKVATGKPIDDVGIQRKRRGEPAPGARPGEIGSAGGKEAEARTTLTKRIAHHYHPGSRALDDIWFRVTVGVSAGSFPVLWALAGAITAILLWIFAGSNPHLHASDKEVGAGILLVVPALLAALALGGEDPPVTRLIGGARLLLLITGLTAVMATAVMVGTGPFQIGQQWMWTACAMLATAVTVPLATSWTLSSTVIWRQLKKLKTAYAQYGALLIGILAAEVGVVILMQLDDNPIPRAGIAVLLLLLAVGMSAIANNRAAIEIGTDRHYAAVSLLAAGFICLVLACIELKAALDEPSGLQEWVEIAAYAALLLSWYAGRALGWTTKGFGPKADEIHVAPSVGRQLLAQERMLELTVLEQRKRNSPNRVEDLQLT